MSIDLFQENMNGLYDRTTKKINAAKTIYLRYNMSEAHKHFLQCQAPSIIYSSWEGFVKQSFSEYLREINSMKLSYADMHDYYVAYNMDYICQFKKPKTSFNAIVNTTSKIVLSLSERAIFDISINTNSNANLKVINSLLKNFRLTQIDEKYDFTLNKLLRFRNSISHGEDCSYVKQRDIDEFSILIQNMVSDIILSLVEGLITQAYMKNDE